MSNEQAKFINSKRRHKNDVAVARQMKIAKAAGITVKEPHKLVKHHAMDCGNPECFLCGNPRKTHNDKLTQQEKRLFQDTEQVRDKHSNGLTPDDQSKL